MSAFVVDAALPRVVFGANARLERFGAARDQTREPDAICLTAFWGGSTRALATPSRQPIRGASRLPRLAPSYSMFEGNRPRD